jgi:hypothetical protein
VPLTEYGTTPRLEWLIRVDVAVCPLAQVRSGRRPKEFARWGGIDQIVVRAPVASHAARGGTTAKPEHVTHTAFRSRRR